MTASGPGLTAEKDAELVFAVTEDRLVVDVQRGENAKKTLNHSGVVRWLNQRGTIAIVATDRDVKIAPDWQRENLRVVAFVQSRKNRRVVAALYAALSVDARRSPARLIAAPRLARRLGSAVRPATARCSILAAGTRLSRARSGLRFARVARLRPRVGRARAPRETAHSRRVERTEPDAVRSGGIARDSAESRRKSESCVSA